MNKTGLDFALFFVSAVSSSLPSFFLFISVFFITFYSFASTTSFPTVFSFFLLPFLLRILAFILLQFLLLCRLSFSLILASLFVFSRVSLLQGIVFPASSLLSLSPAFVLSCQKRLCTPRIYKSHPTYLCTLFFTPFVGLSFFLHRLVTCSFPNSSNVPIAAPGCLNFQFPQPRKFYLNLKTCPCLRSTNVTELELIGSRLQERIIGCNIYSQLAFPSYLRH